MKLIDRITKETITTSIGAIIALFGSSALFYALIVNKIDATTFGAGIGGVVTLATLLLFSKDPKKDDK